MPQPSATALEPRKSPIQARSQASVDAILESPAPRKQAEPLQRELVVLATAYLQACRG